jgi:hypothetical protein
MASHPNIIGKITALTGQATATLNGVSRVLHVGDPVYEGEVVVTATGGYVQIAFNSGEDFLVRANETVTLDPTVFGVEVPSGQDAALTDSAKATEELAKVIAGNGSLDSLFEETAFGFSPGGAQEGHSFVQLLRISEAVGATSYDSAPNMPRRWAENCPAAWSMRRPKRWMTGRRPTRIRR